MGQGEERDGMEGKNKQKNILMSLRGENEQMRYVIVCGGGEMESGDWLAQGVNQSVKGGLQ